MSGMYVVPNERARSKAVAVIAIAVIVVVLSIVVLFYMGSQVTGRLGGPCFFPEGGPLPTNCVGEPTAG